MKKSSMIALSCLLTMSLTAGTALAKPGNGQGAEKKTEAAESIQIEVKATVTGAQTETKAAETSKAQEKAKEKAAKEQEKAAKEQEKTAKEQEKAKDKAEKKATVTSDTYGPGHNGYKGLLKAIENVKDKPAGAVLANLLLTKYEVKLSPEMKVVLEGIREKGEALKKAAELMEKNGSVTDAVYLQEEAVLADVTNLDSYKQLGKMLDKLGKKGVKLYVNGEQPTANTAPIVKDGSTLVPFRAISEALKAEVAWNPTEHSITVTKDGVTLKLIINSKTAVVNGQPQTLEVPATVVNGATVVPVRFVSEAFDAIVKWEPVSQSVVIYNQPTTTQQTTQTTTQTTTPTTTQTTTTTQQ